MWKSFKCNRGTGKSGYMGFADVYNNIVTFILQEPHTKYDNYDRLVLRNNETFDNLFARILCRVNAYTRKTADGNTTRSGDADNQDCETYDSLRICLTEPRELLQLLNFIETYDTRLSYVPRPFYRANVLALATLVQLEDSTIVACLVCGKQSGYSFTEDSVCFTTLSLLQYNRTAAENQEPTTFAIGSYNVPVADIGNTLYSDDADPDDLERSLSNGPVFKEVRHLHHDCCPVMWMHSDENATWNYKDVSFNIRGISKFNHMMQFLTTYPRPNDNAAWLCFVNKLSHCSSPGATRHTIENLLRIICHERLKMSSDRILDDGGLIPDTKRQQQKKQKKQHTGRNSSYTKSDETLVITAVYDNDSPHARSSGPPSDFYREPMHVNSYTYNEINLSDENLTNDESYGLQLGELLPVGLPSNGSHTVLSLLGEEPVSSKLNKTHRCRSAQTPFNQQKEFCLTCTPLDGKRPFVDGTLSTKNFYRLLYLQGFLVPCPSYEAQYAFVTCPTTKSERRYNGSHVCIFCGAVFRNQLMNYENANTYFAPYQVDRLLKYALYGAYKFDTRCVYGRWLVPIPGFQVIYPKDLTSTVLPKRLKPHHESDCRLKQALIWLSSSIDVLHADDCVFRIKKRVYDCAQCCICLEEFAEKDRRIMTCGHWYCGSCYNEIGLSDCCLCKSGYRTSQLTVSNSVLRGYKDSKCFAE